MSCESSVWHLGSSFNAYKFRDFDLQDHKGTEQEVFGLREAGVRTEMLQTLTQLDTTNTHKHRHTLRHIHRIHIHTHIFPHTDTYGACTLEAYTFSERVEKNRSVYWHWEICIVCFIWAPGRKLSPLRICDTRSVLYRLEFKHTLSKPRILVLRK